MDNEEVKGNEPEVEDDEVESSGGLGWMVAGIVIGAVLTLLIIGYLSRGTVFAREVIKLSSSEKAQASAIAEQRQVINIQRMEAQNRLNMEVNKLNEAEAVLNVKANQLCFELKKAHNLMPQANYIVNEVAGEMVKQ